MPKPTHNFYHLFSIAEFVTPTTPPLDHGTVSECMYMYWIQQRCEAKNFTVEQLNRYLGVPLNPELTELQTRKFARRKGLDERNEASSLKSKLMRFPRQFFCFEITAQTL